MVQDDGAPPPTYLAGVGLRSIQERAEELGGRTEIHPGADGWRVSAWIPAS